MTHFWIFLTACLILAVTPGPGLLYVLARAVGNGREDGLRSAAGTFIGGMCHVVAASIGLSALLAASAIAFSVVKYAGAGYLVFLGIRMLMTRNEGAGALVRVKPSGAVRQGIWTEILNPKTALFFLSFIPQFVEPASGHAFLQFLILGSISVTLNTAADVCVVVLSVPIAKRLGASAGFRRGQRTGSGIGMIGLGLYVALHE